MLILIFNVSYKLASAPFFVIGLKRLEEGNQAALKELTMQTQRQRWHSIPFNFLPTQIRTLSVVNISYAG